MIEKTQLGLEQLLGELLLPITFNATRAPVVVSSTSYTTPIPPIPKSRTGEYRLFPVKPPKLLCTGLTQCLCPQDLINEGSEQEYFERPKRQAADRGAW